jgi:hypothetical protein
MKMIPELGINMDIPIELTNVTSDDTYEGDFDSRRVITWQLDFIVKGYLFGPVKKSKYIDRADITSKIENLDVSIQTFTGDYNFDITKTTTEP